MHALSAADRVRRQPSPHSPVTSVSVVTATWNRAKLLQRCYNSLCTQDPLPHEWVIVDDGSTDDTRAVLTRIASDAPFPVRCSTQANSGKHRAINRAMGFVSGELVLILDSDDELTPHAMELITHEWQAIPVAHRAGYAGLVGHSVDTHDRLIGRLFPSDAERHSALRLFHSTAVQGDKLFVHRADILRGFPFPTFANETFVSEGIVWDQIRASYQYRLLNHALQIVEYQSDGLSAKSLAARVTNPAGARAYYQQLASLDIKWPRRLRSLVNYMRFARHEGVAGVTACAQSPWPVVSALLSPAGALAAWVDRARLRAQHNSAARP